MSSTLLAFEAALTSQRLQDMRKVLARNRELQFELDDMREHLAAQRTELAVAQVRSKMWVSFWKCWSAQPMSSCKLMGPQGGASAAPGHQAPVEGAPCSRRMLTHHLLSTVAKITDGQPQIQLPAVLRVVSHPANSCPHPQHKKHAASGACRALTGGRRRGFIVLGAEDAGMRVAADRRVAELRAQAAMLVEAVEDRAAQVLCPGLGEPVPSRLSCAGAARTCAGYGHGALHHMPEAVYVHVRLHVWCSGSVTLWPTLFPCDITPGCALVRLCLQYDTSTCLSGPIKHSRLWFTTCALGLCRLSTRPKPRCWRCGASLSSFVQQPSCPTNPVSLPLGDQCGAQRGCNWRLWAQVHTSNFAVHVPRLQGLSALMRVYLLTMYTC